MLRGRDHRATELYRRALRLRPKHPLAHAGLGIIHYSNALRLAEELCFLPGEPELTLLGGMSPEELYEDDDTVRFRIHGAADSECANARIATYELERAAGLCEDTEEEADLLLMAAHVHGLLSKKRGKEAVQRVLRASPNCIAAHTQLAHWYASDGDRCAAMQEYRFVEKHAPEHADDLAQELARYQVDVTGRGGE